MTIYSYFYRPIQLLIKFVLGKRNFDDQLVNFLNKQKYEEIHEIGCSDGALAINLNLSKTKYYGYDIDRANILKAKKNFSNNKNVKFFYKSIDDIFVKNNKRKIFILKGVFHHLNDRQISNFIKNVNSKDQIIGFDGFYHEKQNLISILLKKMDKGKFIRTYEGYEKILPGFTLKKRISYYLRFYSHLISIKNINNKYF